MELALFDLDNTLLAGDSDFEWAQFLISKGVLDREVQEAKNIQFYEQYKAGTLDIQEFLAFQLTPLVSHGRATLDAWHGEFMTRHIHPIITDAARAKIREHQDAGHLCAVVTATNSFVTGPIVRELGIAHLIATIPALSTCETGNFTGLSRDIPAFQHGKIERVEAWLEAQGLWWGSFSDTWFYSDSLNDLPLLEKVSRPVTVTPDERLQQVAQSRNWPIISLRG